MVNMTFIGQSVPGIRRKLQRLDGALGMNPSQMAEITCKVYNAWEARKIKQGMLFLEKVQWDKGKRQAHKEKKRGSLGANQCAYCKEEDHWR